jgi:hypothetical protein
MTEPLDPPPDPELDRLLQEVFRGKADLAAARAVGFDSLIAKRGPTRGIARRLAGVVTLVVLVVACSLVALAVVHLPSSGSPILPAVSDSPSAQAFASSSPSGSPVGPDGVPLTIDGQPVLRGPAIEAHILAATDDSPFLIGGNIADFETNCFSPIVVSPLIRPCGSGWNLVVGPSLTGLPLVVVANIPGWNANAPLVLRVHVHDSRAAACPATFRTACERAIVVDSVAWTGTLGSSGPSPAGTPIAVADRSVLPACGTETWTSPTGPMNLGARACFINAYRTGQPAEFISTSLTSEGDPITSIYRVLGGGRVEIFIDSSQDRFAGSGRGWEQFECTSLVNVTAPFDAFGPDPGCAGTMLH